MKNAFTMIELIFVIVVIGILAAIAIPKFTSARTDATIVSGKSTVANIQSGLVTERTRRIMRGFPMYPEKLDEVITYTTGQELFKPFEQTHNGKTMEVQILQFPIRSKNSAGGWMKTGANTYDFYINNTTTVTFTYDEDSNSTEYGTFNCSDTDDNCKKYFLN